MYLKMISEELLTFLCISVLFSCKKQCNFLMIVVGDVGGGGGGGGVGCCNAKLVTG